ncbi:MAG TPA: hypothetical protein VFF06_12205, partial [Polyangia bacterium]|nr:hypothetical protein [Polyangia bacterium]
MRIVTAASLVAALLAAPHARAMCRVVVENGTLPPIIEPQQAVLLVLERGVKLGPSCPAPSSDGGGSMASDDGGGSMTSDDGGGSMASDDGGALDDGGPLFTPPDAACPSRI